MPAAQGLGLEDQQSLFPVGEAPGQEEEPEAVAVGEAWFLDLAAEDDELLAEQGILGDQLRFTEREIGGGAQNEGRASGLSETTEVLIQKREEAGEQVGVEVEKQAHTIGDSSQQGIETNEEIVVVLLPPSNCRRIRF